MENYVHDSWKFSGLSEGKSEKHDRCLVKRWTCLQEMGSSRSGKKPWFPKVRDL